MVGDGEYGRAVLVGLGWASLLSLLLVLVVRVRLGVQLLGQHHFLQQNDGRHSVVQSQLVLVQLG